MNVKRHRLRKPKRVFKRKGEEMSTERGGATVRLESEQTSEVNTLTKRVALTQITVYCTGIL